jgi:tetratricopeptide (TPR) repeat protein
VIQSGQETPANLAVAYYDRGFGYDNKHLYDQAIADYTQAIALKPDYANAYGNRGEVYNERGLYDQAIADLSQAIALGATAPDFDQRGNSYRNKGLNEQAIADYRAALRLDPNMQEAKDHLTQLGATP